MPEKVVIEKLDGLKLLLVKVYMKHSRLNFLVLYVIMMRMREKVVLLVLAEVLSLFICDNAKDQIKADASKGLKKIEKYLKFFPIVSVGVKYAF